MTVSDGVVIHCHTNYQEDYEHSKIIKPKELPD
jgi:hypothetical protein